MGCVVSAQRNSSAPVPAVPLLLQTQVFWPGCFGAPGDVGAPRGDQKGPLGEEVGLWFFHKDGCDLQQNVSRPHGHMGVWTVTQVTGCSAVAGLPDPVPAGSPACLLLSACGWGSQGG